MKKAIYLAGAAVMMLASCAKERAEQDSVCNESQQEIQGTVVTIQAAIGSQEAAGQDTPKQNAATKTTQTGGNYSWSDGETISVGTSEGAYTTFTLSNAATGTFTHTFEGDVPDLQMAVSPVQSGSYTGTTNFTVSLPTVYDGYVSGTTNALLIGTPDTETETENKFLFHHAAALVKVTYENVPAGTKGLILTTDQNIAATGAITLTSTNAVITTGNTSLDSKSVRLNLAAAVNDYSPQVFYVPVPTGTYSSFNIYLINAAGEKIAGTEKSSTKSFTLDRKQIFATPGITVSIIIGNENNTSGWQSASSQTFNMAAGERQNLIFENYGSLEDIWNNWVFDNTYISNNTNYEFFVRADPYAWKGSYVAVGEFTTNPGWDKNFLNGSTISAFIDYFGNGLYYLDLTAEKSGTSKHLVYEYTIGEKPASVNTRLVTDNSHYVLKKAWKSTAEPIIRSISAQAKPEVLGAPAYVTLTADDVVVTATMSDGSTQVLDAADYTVTFDSAKYLMAAVENGYVYSSSVAGSIATVHYTGSNGSPADCGCALAAQPNTLEGWSIGTNLNSPWWDGENENYATRSQTFTVASGKSVTLGMKLYSKEEAWYQRPSVIVRKNGLLEEWFTAGMLGFTWINEAETVTTDYSDIVADRETYKAFYNNSDVYATVSNDGNGGISVRYYTYYTDATGDGVSKPHTEYFYKNIGSDQSVDFIIATEGSFEVYQKSVYMTGLEATPNAYIYGNSSYLTLDSSNLTVKAVLSDGSKVTLDPADYSVTFKNAAYNAVGSGYVFSRDESRDIADIAYTGCYGMADGTLSLSYTTQSLTEDGIGSAPASACAWWDDTENTYATKSETFTVSSGQSVTVGMNLFSTEEELFYCPTVIVRHHDGTDEWFNARMIGYSWVGEPSYTGDYNTQEALYQTSLNNSHVYVTVSNDGYGGISVRYYTYYDEAEDIDKEHSEYFYKNIGSDEAVDFIIVMDHAYAVYEKAEVTQTGIEAVANAIVYGESPYAIITKEAVTVYRVYSDGTKTAVPYSEYSITNLYDATYSYRSDSKFYHVYKTQSNNAVVKVTCDDYETYCNITITKRDQIQTTPVGNTTNSSPWETDSDSTWSVEPGQSVTLGMTLGSGGAQRWYSPCIVLKTNAGVRYGVLRMDWYGWDENSFTAISNRTTNQHSTSFDAFHLQNNPTVIITVANHADGKASVSYMMETNYYGNMNYFTEDYYNMTVNQENLKFQIAIENAHVDLL